MSDNKLHELLNNVCKAVIPDNIVLYDNFEFNEVIHKSEYTFNNNSAIVLVAIIDGTAEIELNGNIFHLKKGDVFSITDVFVYNHLNNSENMKFIGIEFYPAMIDASKKYLKMNHSIFSLEKENFYITHVDKSQIDYCKDLYMFLYKWIFNDSHIYQKNIVQHICNVFIIKAVELINQGRNSFDISQKTLVSRQNIVFNNFIKLLEQYSYKYREVKFYAKKLDVTPKYLSDVTRIYTNQCASDNIEQFVTKQIIALLSEEKYSIKEICSKMNFNSQSFFGRYFKRATGMSPREYLKNQK